MKILHVIEFIAIGGAEKLLCNTIAELPHHEHFVLTLYPSADLSLLPKGTAHQSLNISSKLGFLSKRKQYRAVIAQFKPDLVHSHLYFATVLAKAFTPSFIPLVFTQHSEFSVCTGGYHYKTLDRFVSKHNHTCVAVSNVVLQNYLASTKFKGKTVVIGNYVPDDYFQLNRNGRDSKQLRLVALGNIKAVKNQQYLLRAFSFLKNMPVSCDVYGEGTDRLQFEEKARAEKLAVYFKGSVADSRAVLANYDLYIMPSLTEGFPLSLFEAAAVGLPPVVSDIPVFHEVLDDCGDYLPLNDPGQLRIVIQKYLANPDLLEQKSREIKKLALKKASRTTYVQKLEMLYSSLSAPI